MFTSIINRLKRAGSKKLVVASTFIVALTAAAALGFATKQFASADIVRDCDTNAIMRCGAADAKEFIADAKANNGRTQKVQSDIQGIYTNKGLSPSEYTRFEQTAQNGTVYRDGRVVVNGQTVLTNAMSMGREKWGKSTREAFTINGKTYYRSTMQNSFASGVNSLPVMVMFDAKGQVEFIAMNACGNPVWGTPVKPEYSCKALNQKALGNNTYEYTTTVGTMKNATINKVVYNFGDGSAPVTKTNPTDKVTHKFTKSSTVTVTAYFNVPGKGVVAAPVVVNCTKKVTVTPPPAPSYACSALSVTVRNDEKTEYRFTAKTTQANGATLKDVDFTLDNVTTTGVTTKDAQGLIYKDYTIAKDGKEHKIVAKVNFNVASGVQSKTCEAKVKSDTTPVCEVPGKEMYPPNAPECAWCEVPGKEDLPKDSPECVKPPEECKPGIPVGDDRCEDTPPVTPPTPEVPTELPHTGIGSAFGLFAGVSAAAGVAHRVITRKRD